MAAEYRDQDRDTQQRGRNQASRNDVSWYSRNPSLLMAAASLPFPYRPGMAYQQFVTKQIPDGYSVETMRIPGVTALRWYPTVGYSTSATDPASVVGKEMFAKVREKFSGSIDADAPDFVIYVMALDSVFSYIASLKRVYRILNAYTSENHYVPDILLTDMGFQPSAILAMKQNRMQLFQVINELVHMTRKFNLPAVFDIINRHYWLNDNVYLDADTLNAQFYMFVCMGYYKYGLTSTTGGVQVGSLTMESPKYPTDDTIITYLFEFGRGLIDALAGSDDAYIISGYLMRAYEGAPVFTVDEIPVDDRLIPHYDPEVLMQIENARPLDFGTNLPAVTLSNNVTQDPSTNSIICVPHYSCNITQYSGMVVQIGNVLSIRSDAPTVADVTIATRLKMGSNNYSVTDSVVEYDIVCGSEILSDILVTAWTDLNGKKSQSNWSFYGYIIPSDAKPWNSISMAAIQSFDWHPILPVIIPNGTSKKITIAQCGDVHNVTPITDEILNQINRVCLYSEFNSYGQI